MIVTPPGWPLVLAGLLKISPTFLWLKLCLIGMMLGSAGLNYRVLRRFASPRLAATVVVLAGLLGWVYPLTMWLHTEALFLLMTSASMLLAARLGEGRGGWGHVAGLVVLSFLMVFTRWPGLFVWPILAALAAGPHWRPARGPRWAAVGLTLVVMAGGFLATRQGMLWYASRTVTTDELTGDVTTADGEVDSARGAEPRGQGHRRRHHEQASARPAPILAAVRRRRAVGERPALAAAAVRGGGGGRWPFSAARWGGSRSACSSRRCSRGGGAANSSGRRWRPIAARW